MRLGIIVARRITPALSHAPRHWCPQPCVPTRLVPRHKRSLHVGSGPGPAPEEARTEVQNNENTSDAEIAPGEKDQALEDQAPKADSDPSPPHVAPSTAAATENVETESQDKRYAPVADTATGEKDQPSKLDSAAPSPEKPERDHTWVFDYAGSKISVLGRGVGSDGYEEFVDSEGGAKLICSWSVGRSDEPVMWVPGDAPRLRDLELPVEFQAEMSSSADKAPKWPMGNPHSSFEPFFNSLAAMNPKAKFDKTDVIARAADLQRLMGFACGTFLNLGNANVAHGFQFELVKNTLLIKKLLNTRRGGKILGRGMSPTFQGAFINRVTEMAPSEEDVSPDHYQAIRYHLGPLHCVAITSVEAASGDDSLPPIAFHGTSPLLPKDAVSVDVRHGGRGVPPTAVTQFQTAVTNRPPTNNEPVSARGHLKMKPAAMLKTWLSRPASILQGHLRYTDESGETALLTRINVRDTKIVFATIEQTWALELRRLVVLLGRMRETVRKAGGPCILTYQPPKREYSGGPMVVPAIFEIYKANAEAGPVVLDWHVKHFWSEDQKE